MKNLIILVLLLSGVAQAQDTNHGDWCKSHEKYNASMKSNLNFAANINALNSNVKMGEFRDIIIPVVIHILYTDSSEITSLDEINTQLEGLNADFNGENWDVGNTPSDFKKRVGDLRMRFKLATIDPDGKETNGITYTKTNTPVFYMESENAKFDILGGKNSWDTKRYLNIWVCNLEGGLRGYAQFPGDTPSTDGVVASNNFFGVYDSVTVYNEQKIIHHRLLTHEVGHWVGLFHIWGDWWCGDDKVKDTPTQIRPHFNCYSEEGIETCGSDDLTVNFMDYVEADCMVMFTKGQKKRAMKSMSLLRRSIVKNGKKLTKVIYHE